MGGLANTAGGFFGALPTGGSLSRTGVATSGGAQTRWAGTFAGLWLIVLVLARGPLAGAIPMAVIGGLLIVFGGELVVGRWGDIRLVLRTSWLSTAAMVATFAATTQLPLQVAIFLGRTVVAPLGSTGGGCAGGVRPREDPRGSRSSTFLKSFDRVLERGHEQGIEVVVCGVPDDLRARFAAAGGELARLRGRVIAESEVLLGSVQEAYDLAERLRTERAVGGHDRDGSD